MQIYLGNKTVSVPIGAKEAGLAFAEAWVVCGADVYISASGQADLDFAPTVVNTRLSGKSIRIQGDIADAVSAGVPCKPLVMAPGQRGRRSAGNEDHAGSPGQVGQDCGRGRFPPVARMIRRVEA